MKSVAISAALGGLLLAGPVSGTGVEQVAWMEGLWVGGGGESPDAEELWTAPRGGMMLGLHRDVGPGERVFFEFLRIAETPDGLVFFASPKGSEATAFRMIESSEGRVVFENPEHDFPQRIGYRLEGEDTLVAWIEGNSGGEVSGSEWRWSRSGGAACDE